MIATDEKFSKSINELAALYNVPGRIVSAERTGNGHINDTFKVVTAGPTETQTYIFQRVNESVFTKPEIIMDNLKKVSDYIDEKFGSDSAEAGMILTFEKNSEGNNFARLSDGFWRVSKFIDACSYDSITDSRVLYNSGSAFGRFQDILSGLDANTLVETIPDFHNTVKRTEAFFEGLERDAAGRASTCMPEIAFFEKHKNDFSRLVELHECGILPYRVTHNDTKINNILIDKNDGRPLCVVDLDTVMPGLASYDFGDAIRFGANYSAEDETDLEKVGLNFEYYEQFTRGYVTAAKPFLTVSEKDSLALAAMTMTYEVAIRFLLDYLNGDIYFRIHRENHNLERARCQIRLCEDMMANYAKMCSIVDKYYN
ncbi:MAG: aminoglycoside phosphotransferase family protein [Clostridia bacterium]|nr:aminoglycoside phosphotransferase family protein [Clostridia bacterium]